MSGRMRFWVARWQATPKKTDFVPANFQLNIRVDPFRNSVLRGNVN